MRIRLDVREILQSASSGSYVVGYTAELETNDRAGEVSLKVISTMPEEADPFWTNELAEATRLGFADALASKGLGATGTLESLLVNIVDSNPGKQHALSANKLKALLEGA